MLNRILGFVVQKLITIGLKLLADYFERQKFKKKLEKEMEDAKETKDTSKIEDMLSNL